MPSKVYLKSHDCDGFTIGRATKQRRLTSGFSTQKLDPMQIVGFIIVSLDLFFSGSEYDAKSSECDVKKYFAA